MKLTRKEMIYLANEQRENPCQNVFTFTRSNGVIITASTSYNSVTVKDVMEGNR